MRQGAARRLLTVFVAGSFAAMVAITVLSGIGVHRIYDVQIMRHAEHAATDFAEAIYAQEREALGAGRGGRARTLAPAPDAVPALDARMRRYLEPLGIVKLKAFDLDGRIVYSTDAGIIGRVDTANPRLALALRGLPHSQLKKKERVWEVAGEQRFDADLVETYIPVRDGGRVIGALETYTDVTWARTESGFLLRMAIGVVLGVLVVVFAFFFTLMRIATRRVERAEQDLERLAVTDSVTGLVNRGHLMTRAAEECARLARNREDGRMKAHVGFLMVDLDLFKDVNDTHGHQVGDEVLREVAERIRKVTRVYDVVGRYGGDEFLVIAPDADDEAVRRLAHRACEAVRATPVATAAGLIPVTISAGYATTTETDVAAAIRRADVALYGAKDAGRNRVGASAEPAACPVGA